MSIHFLAATMMSRPSDYEYSEEKQLTLPEFHRRYKDNLPLLIIVTEGFYGETKYDDYANDQVRLKYKEHIPYINV